MKEIKETSHHSWPLGALILIFLGVVFLLNNFGILPWSAWNSLWKLWPLIFIFMGLEAIFDHSEPMRVVLFIGALVVLIYLILALTGNNNLPIKIPFLTPTPSPLKFRMPMYYNY